MTREPAHPAPEPPPPPRCAACGLDVAAWRVVRGEAVFCTWVCLERAEAAARAAAGQP